MVKTILAALAACLLAEGAAAQAQAQEFDLNAVDANRDGAVTRAEAHDARAVMFTRADLDHDQALSESEREAVARTIAERGARRLERADANRDGAITVAEFMSQPYRAFDLFDWNRDGVLNPTEITALRAGLGL